MHPLSGIVLGVKEKEMYILKIVIFRELTRVIAI